MALNEQETQPLISTIIRTQNRLPLLKRAVKCVAMQTYPNKEIVVVNDGGPSIKIEETLSEFHFSTTPLHTYHLPQSKGRSYAGNYGYYKSKGDYLVFLDDDDTWEINFLSATSAFLKQHNSEGNWGGVITHTSKIEETTNSHTITIKRKQPYRFLPQKVSLMDLAERNFIPIHSLLFKRTALNGLPPLNEALPYLEDWDLFLRIASGYDIGLIPLALANYHFRKNAGDTSLTNSVTKAKDQCLYYETYLRNYYLRKDLATGKLGLGIIMNLSYGMRNLSFWQYLKNDLRKLSSKWKS